MIKTILIAYTLSIDPAHADMVNVALTLRGAPREFRLAMKVHAEYNAGYWRNVDSLRVEAAGGGITRIDSTLWSVRLPSDSATIRYSVHITPPPARGPRSSWQPYVSATGALINPPDVFLYIPELAAQPVSVTVDAPRAWTMSTALDTTPSPARFIAANAVALFDAPIMLGSTLWERAFTDRGTTFHVVYLPAPGAPAFDADAFTHGVAGLVHAALDLFGRAPSSRYYFLVQDNAFDALEHRASLTIGIPSARLAVDPHAALFELAHEFVHTWNLVAIRPAKYNDLSYGPSARTDLLWLSEGVTLYYAGELLRRAGLVSATQPVNDRLVNLLQRYYANPAVRRVSPAAASLAFGDSRIANANATGGYYSQGELLGFELEALVRDSTEGSRGLDDVMRALFARSTALGASGFTQRDVMTVANGVCRCRLDAFFARQVQGGEPIDLSPVFRRLGVRAVIDSIPATDSAGRALPDLRLDADVDAANGRVIALGTNPYTVWAKAGLRRGDRLVRFVGRDTVAIGTIGDLRRAQARFAIGDTVTLEVQRGASSDTIQFVMQGYVRPRVRLNP